MPTTREITPSQRYLIFLFALIAAYLPVLQSAYLHTDDYFWSHWGEWNWVQVMNFMTPIGRPTAGLIYLAFSTIKSFRDTAWFRFISMLNLFVMCTFLYQWAKKWKVPSLLAISMLVALVTLPPFQVFVSYISALPHGLSVTLSVAALFLSQRAYEHSKLGTTGWRLWQPQVAAIGLLVLSFTINQVGALFFIAALSMPLIRLPEVEFISKSKAFLFFHGKTLAMGIGCYYTIFRIYLSLNSVRNFGKYDVRNFVQDYGARIRWFFEWPLFESANLWKLNPTSQFSAGIVVFLALIAVAGIFSSRKLLHGAGYLSVLAKPFALLLLFPLGFAISLASGGPSPEYRTYPVLAGLLIFILALSPDYLLERWKWHTARSRFHVMVALIAVYGVYTCHKSVNDYFAFPDSLEFRLVKAGLKTYLKTGKELEGVHVYIPLQNFASPQERHDLGEPNLRHAPNIRPIILAALYDLGYRKLPERITCASGKNDPEWTDYTPKHGSVVDFEVRKFKPELVAEHTAIIDMSSINLN